MSTNQKKQQNKTRRPFIEAEFAYVKVRESSSKNLNDITVTLHFTSLENVNFRYCHPLRNINSSNYLFLLISR